MICCRTICGLLFTLLASPLFAQLPITTLPGVDPFETAGPNLLPNGNFELGADDGWGVDNNRGAFSVRRTTGYHGQGVELVSQGTKDSDRGKFLTKVFQVPAATAIRVSLWAKPTQFDGGVWVNLEGQGADNGSELFLAGGTQAWQHYTFRMTTKGKLGQTVPLSLWMYVYGKGSIAIDEVFVQEITADLRKRREWSTAQAQRIVERLDAQAKPANLSKLLEQVDGDLAFENLAQLVRASAQMISGTDSFGVVVANSAKRVFRDQPFVADFSSSVDLHMARHEREGAQVVLFANSEDLKNVRVSLEPLTGPGEFGLENIEIYPVAYGDRSAAPKLPWYTGPNTRYWPDPLLPNRKFTVERGSTQPIYLRVYCPQGTKPGKYQGHVVIRTSSATAKLPLTITVYSTSIPVALKLKTMHVGGKSERSYQDLALQQRMGLGTVFSGMSWTNPNFPQQGRSYDFSKVERELQYSIDRGLNSFLLAQTPKSGKFGFPKQYSPRWKAKMSHVLREYGRFLAQKGWLDMAYYNNIDEPWNNRWPQVKELYAMAKKANPAVKVFSCVNRVGALDNLRNHADTFDVYIQHFHQQQASARQKEGKEIWWAVCIWPDEHPNLFIEYPLMDARIIGWMSHVYDIAGFEYWSMTSWNGDWQKAGKKAPQNGSWANSLDGVLTTSWPYSNEHSGDGYLAYPGDNDRPINSLRFEALRDGLEENELLQMLEQKISSLSGGGKLEALAIVKDGQGLVTNAHLYSLDATKLAETKKRILILLSQ